MQAGIASQRGLIEAFGLREKNFVSFWKGLRDQAALNRLRDEEFHAAALREIESGVRRDGLWAKAVIEANGNEKAVKIRYMQLLVIAIRDETYLHGRVAEEQQAETTRKRYADAQRRVHEEEDQRRPQEQSVRRAAEPRNTPKNFSWSTLRRIDNATYNNLLQSTSELRLHYLLRRWYTSQDSAYVLDGNAPGPIVQELQKYLKSYGP